RARSGAGRARVGTGRSRSSEMPKVRALRASRVWPVAGGLAEVPARVFRPAIEALVPYEPGKPVEEVQRELGLERVVKLASNEGPFGPFPKALEALERSIRELNRYPDGGAYALR